MESVEAPVQVEQEQVEPVESVEPVEQEAEYVEVKKKPRAKRVPKAKPPPVEIPAPVADAEFWHGMMRTKREMDRAETRARYANLVTFK